MIRRSLALAIGLVWVAYGIGSGALAQNPAGISGGTALRPWDFGPGGTESGLRPTNVEVRILSQSSFQGEVTPCG